MTIAELLRKEGRTEGLEQGEREGRMEVAKTMVHRGMDWETIATSSRARIRRNKGSASL